jgi:hypothetical protein
MIGSTLVQEACKFATLKNDPSCARRALRASAHRSRSVLHLLASMGIRGNVITYPPYTLSIIPMDKSPRPDLSSRRARFYGAPAPTLAKVTFNQSARTSQQRGQGMRRRCWYLPQPRWLTRLVGAILLEQNDAWHCNTATRDWKQRLDSARNQSTLCQDQRQRQHDQRCDDRIKNRKLDHLDGRYRRCCASEIRSRHAIAQLITGILCAACGSRMNGTREGSSMLFEYFACEWVGRKRCVNVETNLPPVFDTPGGGFCGSRWWTSYD